MQITPKENIENFSLPLPIYQMVHIADADHNGEQFFIFIGLDKNLVEQVKRYSADKSDVELQKNTSDWKRFVENSYEDWYRKGRTPFSLVNKKTGDMAAIMRFGPEAILGDSYNWHTVGWRSYNPWRGKGVMKEFARFTMDFYRDRFPGIRFWITARKDNIGSIKLAEFLGFISNKEKSELVAREEKRESLVMTKE